ncbi:hypothetical protein [Amycolatopsis sp.]|uniref:hypothetical protein n=1 Tax=Amycolatopsis sp. TaxID=37632 RepID=UPI002D7F81D4|nr:hypothetical protein [Amycolatopsis sp.]HET6706427.1 hypothetical protein [Amycolatopsis sp.]
MNHEDTVNNSYRELRPPTSLLAAAACSVLGALVTLGFPDFDAHVAGYVLGSLVSTGLVMVFMKVDLARRTSGKGIYLDRRSTRFLWSVVLLAGLVGCAVHAWHIATALAVR